MFSCEFCEISEKTFSYRTPPVAASVLTYSHNPDKSNISMHLSALQKSLDLYYRLYESFVILGGFNVEVDMKDFCESYNLVKVCYVRYALT